MAAPELSVFIVEDHAVMRQTLVGFLIDAGGIDVKGAAASAEETLDRLETIDAKILVVDLSLPGMNGIELVKQVLAQRDDLTCIIYTGHGQKHYVGRALAAGVRGYLLKGDPDDLLVGLDRVHRGEVYVSPPLRESGEEEG